MYEANLLEFTYKQYSTFLIEFILNDHCNKHETLCMLINSNDKIVFCIMYYFIKLKLLELTVKVFHKNFPHLEF